MTYRTEPHPLVLFAGHGRVVARARHTGKFMWSVWLNGATSRRDQVVAPGTYGAVTRIAWVNDTIFAYGVSEVSNGFFATPQTAHVVMAIEAVSGVVRWRQRIVADRESVGTMLVDRDMVFVTSRARLVALRAETGDVLWNEEYDAGGGALGMAIAVEGNAVQADGTGLS